MTIAINKMGTIRFYDSAVTPYYLELAFSAGDLAAPLGFGRPEERLMLDRGVMDANAHYIPGPDMPIMEMYALTFSAFIQDTTNFQYFEELLKALNDSTQTVNSNTWTTTKGDTQRDGSNANPAFFDTNKKACNVELLYSDANITDFGYRWNEVYFPLNESEISEAEDGNKISLNGQIYGTFERITAFTSGTDVTA